MRRRAGSVVAEVRWRGIAVVAAVWVTTTLAQASSIGKPSSPSGDVAPDWIDADFIRQAAALSGDCKAGYVQRHAHLPVARVEWLCNCTAIRSLKAWRASHQGRLQGLGIGEDGFLRVAANAQAGFHELLQHHEAVCAREAHDRFVE